MGHPDWINSLTPTTLALAKSVVESVAQPAIIVYDASAIVAANSQWMQLQAVDHAPEDPTRVNDTRCGCTTSITCRNPF